MQSVKFECDSCELRSNIASSTILWVKPHLIKGGDWSQDVFKIAQNGVFSSNM